MDKNARPPETAADWERPLDPGLALSRLNHDIRTPLNAVGGLFELLGAGASNNKQRKWSGLGLHATDQIARDIDRIVRLGVLQTARKNTSDLPHRLGDLLKIWAESQTKAVAVEAADTAKNMVVSDPAGVMHCLSSLVSAIDQPDIELRIVGAGRKSSVADIKVDSAVQVNALDVQMAQCFAQWFGGEIVLETTGPQKRLALAIPTRPDPEI